MKVWVLNENVEYEGVFMIGIFSSEKRAEQEAVKILKQQRLKRNGRKDDLTVEPYIVDKGEALAEGEGQNE